MRTILVASLVCLLVAAVGRTEDKPKDKTAVKKPTGTWTREVDNNTMTFTIRADDIHRPMANRVHGAAKSRGGEQARRPDADQPRAHKHGAIGAHAPTLSPKALRAS